MKNILSNHSYGSTWGIACFYDDCEALLRKAVTSGEDFYAEWGAKKEITYAEVERSDDTVKVKVRTSIDELPQLVDTAVWHAFGGNEFSTCGFDAICKLHDLDRGKDVDYQRAVEIMEEIEQGVLDIYQQHFELYETLPITASFEDIVASLEKLEGQVEDEAAACFEDIVENIQVWWDAIQEEGDMNSGRFA